MTPPAHPPCAPHTRCSRCAASTVDVRADGSVDTAARFVADQPGAAARILTHPPPAESGDRAGCAPPRPTPWPCVLAHLARRAEQLTSADHRPSSRAHAFELGGAAFEVSGDGQQPAALPPPPPPPGGPL